MKTIYDLLTEHEHKKTGVYGDDPVSTETWNWQTYELMKTAIKMISTGDLSGFDYLAIADLQPVDMYKYLTLCKKEIRFQKNNIKNACLDILYQTMDIDYAQYALVLLTLVPQDEESYHLVLLYLIGKPFRYYALRVIISWKDGNQELLNLLKEYECSDDILRLLKVDNDEIKNWLLLKCPINEHSIYTLFEKSGAYDLLASHKPMSDEVYHRISHFIYVLTEKRSFTTISHYEDAYNLLKSYLEASKDHQKTMKDYYAIGHLLTYILISYENEMSDCEALAKVFVTSKECRSLLKQDLSQKGMGIDFAIECGLPYVGRYAKYVFKHFKEDPYIIQELETGYHHLYFMPDRVVVALLPYLQKYYKQTGDLSPLYYVRHNLYKHPGVGEDLIQLCLKSDNENLVETAHKILGAWKNCKSGEDCFDNDAFWPIVKS